MKSASFALLSIARFTANRVELIRKAANRMKISKNNVPIIPEQTCLELVFLSRLRGNMKFHCFNPF